MGIVNLDDDEFSIKGDSLRCLPTIWARLAVLLPVLELSVVEELGSVIQILQR